MKFMCLVNASENQGFPPPELMEAIGKLGEEAAQAGTMVEMGGLLPTAMSSRIRMTGGELITTDGPFTEAKEVVGGYAVYDVPTKEEAMKWATRFMELHRQHWPSFEGEVEVRPLFEAGDFDPTAMQA